MPVLWWIILWRASCIKVLPLKSQEIAVFPFYPIHRRLEVQSGVFFNQLELPTGDLSLEGLYDLNDYSSAVTAHGCIGNYGQLIGHGTLRGAVMGFVDRDPTPEEMERLKALLRRELEAGAFGMSLGLIYPPSSFCKRGTGGTGQGLKGI